MKKTEASRAEFIGLNVRLTKEDLEEVLEVFNHNLHDVIIEDGEKTYDSLDDLEAYSGKYIGHLVITGHGPYSFFEINNPANRRVRLLTENTNPWTQGFHSLTELLGKRKRFKNDGIPTFGLIISAIIFALLLAYTWEHRIPPIAGILGFLVFFMILTILISKAHYGHLNIVTLHRQHEMPSFWRVNKDTIITGVIGSIIGAGFALLVAYLIYRFGIK